MTARAYAIIAQACRHVWTRCWATTSEGERAYEKCAKCGAERWR